MLPDVIFSDLLFFLPLLLCAFAEDAFCSFLYRIYLPRGLGGLTAEIKFFMGKLYLLSF
jgi:hypothetical protein